MLLIDIKRFDMGPVNLKWVQYYFLVKCVGFEPFDKVGPDTFEFYLFFG